MKKRFLSFIVSMAALLFLAAPLQAAPAYYDGNFTNILLKGYLVGPYEETIDNLTDGYWTVVLPATGLFNVTVGNLKVGNGTPSLTLGGEDAYVEGTFEVDGAVRLDNASLTLRGIAYTIPAADGAASTYLQTNGSGVLSWAAGTSGTLDQAYDAGITITADAGAVAITNNAADNNGVMTLSKSPVGAQSGDILTITGGSNGTGDMLQFANTGSGNDVAGTGGLWYVTKAGAATFASGSFTSVTTTNWYQTDIVAAAAGNQALTVNAAGNGTITVGGVSTGNTIFPGVVAFNGNATIGDAATDTLTLTSIINSNVTLDDGAGASPSLIFKDATDETATFSKADAGVLSLTTDATDGLNILVGNLWVGNGSPGTASMNGEDAYVEGQLEVDGAVQFDGALTAAAGATVSGGTINLNASSNSAVNIGTGTTTSAVTIGGAGIQQIDIGNGAAAKTVALGSSNSTSTTTLLSGSGALNLNASNNQPTNINSGTSTGTVTVGGSGIMAVDIGTGGTGAKTITIGDGASTGTTAIKAGSGGVGINVSNNHPTNIGTGTTTGTVTIGGNGVQAIDIGNGAAAKTVALGSSNSTSTTTLLSGSGGIKINENNNQPVDIGTGTTTGTVTIGGAGIQAIDIGNGAAAKTVALGSSNTTSTTTISSGSGGIVMAGNVSNDGTNTLGGFLKTVTDDTDGKTLNVNESGTVQTNAGAIGAAAWTLPGAAAGINYCFVVMAAQELRVTPAGGDAINIAGSQGDAAEYWTANAVGESLCIVAVDATNWVAKSYTGTWAQATP